MAMLFFAGLGLTYFVFTRVPTGFVPDEDQGYFIIVIQAPSGASLEYTKAIGKQVSALLADVPEAEGTFSVAGFSFAGAGSQPGNHFRSVEAIFAAQRRCAYRVGDSEPHSSADVWSFGSDRVSDAAAADSGSGTVRRISVRGAGSGCAQTRRTGRCDARIDAAGSAAQGSGRGCSRRSPRTIRSIW